MMILTYLAPLLLCSPPFEPEPAERPHPVAEAFPVLDADATPSLWERLRFSANGRLRAESTFDQPNGHDRHRGRLRMRIGAEYDLLENLVMKARLSTASDGRDANNPHWDFGDGMDGFSAAELGLDRFYADWAACESLSLRAGKQPHAFARPPVYGEFSWDGDVHPAGVAATWDLHETDTCSADVRLVEYVAVENGGDEDPSVFGAQANVSCDVEEKTRVTLSTSLSDWGNLDAGAPPPSNQGNTDITADFSVLEGFLSADHQGGPLGRTTGFVQYLNNLEDKTGEDHGLALGARFGQSGSQGDANVFGVWYELDANAVYSPVAQDDTPIAGTGIGTGSTGVIFGGQYFVRDNLSFKLWVLTSDADAADDPFRIRLDLDFVVR